MTSVAVVMTLGAAVLLGGAANANPVKTNAVTGWQTTDFSSQQRHGHSSQRVARPHRGARHGQRRVHGGGHGGGTAGISIGVGGGGDVVGNG